jgi:hypothetical protein
MEDDRAAKAARAKALVRHGAKDILSGANKQPAEQTSRK